MVLTAAFLSFLAPLRVVQADVVQGGSQKLRDFFVGVACVHAGKNGQRGAVVSGGQ
jgi:hypothetical protein